MDLLIFLIRHKQDKQNTNGQETLNTQMENNPNVAIGEASSDAQMMQQQAVNPDLNTYNKIAVEASTLVRQLKS